MSGKKRVSSNVLSATLTLRAGDRPAGVAMFFRRNGRDFEAAVQPELPVLYRVARRMCGNEHEAEDIVAQALVRAFQAWNRFDGQHLRSWLIKILRNEFLGKRRSDNSRPEAAELADDAAVDEGFWDEVNWRLASERILDELDRLPLEFRMAVQLCDVEQMSYEDAAEAMGVPIGTVRSRLFRGRARLRDRLAASLGLEGARP